MSKHWRLQLKTTLRHQIKLIEEEIEVKKTRIIETNTKNLKIFNLMILKGKEEVEEVVIQLVTNPSQHTNQMLNAIGATSMTIINQNVDLIYLKDMVKNLIL